MIISQVKLIGFRNFKNATINFDKKSLIIGANDIGKSNLLYALRLLLDKSISDMELEPKDSDFYVYDDTHEISILIKFIEAEEDCLRSKLGKHISDDGTFYLRYSGLRDKHSGSKSYSLWVGKDENSLEETDCRFYLRVLNLKYISSTRDLYSYIKKERKNLLEDTKLKRTDDERIIDDKNINKIEKTFDVINKRITRLSYINKATTEINKELSSLSLHHTTQSVVFDVCGADASAFTDNLELVSQVRGKSIKVGGDGKNNQIFLALWASRNEINSQSPEEVTIYSIEEPEAHLHPHQQRKLAEYLAKTLSNQVIITTHSPQIACEFPPNSLILLQKKDSYSFAAKDGCCGIIEDAFIEFGYRLNIIPAEAFFSDVVLLVEGYSEVLFYKALAEKIGIDLDKLNISILMVDGVGFEPYINLLSALGIYYVLRTDNDIIRIPKKSEYYLSGVMRCIKFYKNHYKGNLVDIDTDLEKLLENESNLKGFTTPIPPQNVIKLAGEIKDKLEVFGLYLSDTDLENDLINSGLNSAIKDFVGETDDSETVKIMQEHKATFMYKFLLSKSDALSSLDGSDIAKPLIRCKEIVEAKNA